MRALAFVGPWDLHPGLALFDGGPDEVEVVIVRSIAKGGAMPWHRKKLVLVLSAMAHFAQELRAAGFTVTERTAATYVDGIQAQLAERPARALRLMQPKEWGLRQRLHAATWDLPVVWHEDAGPGGHFLLSEAEFAAWAGQQKTQHLRMDSFYRVMRKRLGVLLDDDGKPVGGKWSYDADNRKAVKDEVPPPGLDHSPDALTAQIMEEVAAWPGLWGEVEGFAWPVTRAAALAELRSFVRERLGRFGAFQDAMVTGEPWLWHARLSAAMNLGLLQPMEVVDEVLAGFVAGNAPLNSVEGMIRQVIGWREFIRGVYWLRMPDMREANALQGTRPLPDFYWDPSKTKMRCVKEAVTAVRDHGYAHHIQRLMVLGNFALLAGLKPLEVSHWFWAGFVDAYEWVELPNVHGMALFADTSFTTKPYAASGNYIHKMGNHCKTCHYKVKKKHGEDACPFNPLFWDFMLRHRDRLSSNHRLARLYATWERKSQADKEGALQSAAQFLAELTPADHGWSFDDDAA